MKRVQFVRRISGVCAVLAAAAIAFPAVSADAGRVSATATVATATPGDDRWG